MTITTTSLQELRARIATASKRPNSETPLNEIHTAGATQFDLHTWFEGPFIKHGERAWPTYGNVLAILDTLDAALERVEESEGIPAAAVLERLTSAHKQSATG